ncbi:major facilitator superfamily domain-containing protein [Fennellomyces sp. T-0311]|nr:major facilitator superfamily domain-containing protein [Fennellomyces sp. T-0311]
MQNLNIYGKTRALHDGDEYLHSDDDDASSNDPSINTRDGPELRTYPRAWLVLFALILLRAAAALFQFTFSVVPNQTSQFYSIDLTVVNWLATIQTLVYIIFSFFTGWIYERFGVKKSLILAGLLCVTGSLLRFISSKIKSVVLLFVGQAIGSGALPVSLNIMTKFAATWFTERWRATAGMLVASNYGAIMSMFMVPAITTLPEQLPMTLLIITIISGAFLVPTLFTPSKPPEPPSLIDDEVRPSLRHGIKLLAKNFNFWLLFIVHGINIGLSIGFGAVFAEVIAPYGYTAEQAGRLNAFGFFSGIVGSTVSGLVLDKTKQHTLFLKMFAPMILLCDVGFIFIIRTNAYAAIQFVLVMDQFFLSFMVPVVIELGSETSYPVAEGTSSSILWQGGQLFGFVIINCMDQTREADGEPPNNMRNALVVQAGLSGVLCFCAFLFRGKMMRTKAIAHKREEQKEKAEEEFMRMCPTERQPLFSDAKEHDIADKNYEAEGITVRIRE